MNARGAALRHLLPLCALLAVVAGTAGGCAELAKRVAQVTAKSERGGPATAASLDRDDITALVSDYLTRLQASAFWEQTVTTAEKRPVVAVWSVQNATAQQVGEMPFLLWSIETSLAKTKSVSVADRGRQEQVAKDSGIAIDAVVDAAAARKLGRALGAEYFVSGKLTASQGIVDTKPQQRYALYLQVLD
ncbi:MAG: hypothetical protein HY899_19955, partial [Deltaproteobacteria bacterium]|nr:hypothetical protein [Deltaproteobacteria bacterium]